MWNAAAKVKAADLFGVFSSTATLLSAQAQFNLCLSVAGSYKLIEQGARPLFYKHEIFDESAHPVDLLTNTSKMALLAFLDSFLRSTDPRTVPGILDAIEFTVGILADKARNQMEVEQQAD